MDASQFFQSAYLNAKNLDGEVELRIERVEIEKVGMLQEKKLVVHFQNYPRGLVLNKPNYDSLFDAFGPETGDWLGRRVTLYVAETEYGGKKTDGIRIKVASGDTVPQSNWSTPIPVPASEMNDEVPF